MRLRVWEEGAASHDRAGDEFSIATITTLYLINWAQDAKVKRDQLIFCYDLPRFKLFLQLSVGVRESAAARRRFAAIAKAQQFRCLSFFVATVRAKNP